MPLRRLRLWRGAPAQASGFGISPVILGLLGIAALAALIATAERRQRFTGQPELINLVGQCMMMAAIGGHFHLLEQSGSRLRSCRVIARSLTLAMLVGACTPLTTPRQVAKVPLTFNDIPREMLAAHNNERAAAGVPPTYLEPAAGRVRRSICK